MARLGSRNPRDLSVLGHEPRVCLEIYYALRLTRTVGKILAVEISAAFTRQMWDDDVVTLFNDKVFLSCVVLATIVRVLLFGLEIEDDAGNLFGSVRVFECAVACLSFKSLLFRRSISVHEEPSFETSTTQNLR